MTRLELRARLVLGRGSAAEVISANGVERRRPTGSRSRRAAQAGAPGNPLAGERAPGAVGDSGSER
jgi:hypothetical protein